MRCPKCGDEDHIDIHAAVWVRLTSDGTDADASACGDHVWCPKSMARCVACDHNGTVADFTPKEQPADDTEVQDFPTFLPSIAGRKFELGQIVATSGALEACPPSRRWHCLASHARGDWGCVSKADAAENDLSLKQGFRLLSAYPLDPTKPCKGFGDNTLWIITEADRSATTFLLPSEY